MHWDQNSPDKISRYKVLVHKQLTGPRASPVETTVPAKLSTCLAVGVPLDKHLILSCRQAMQSGEPGCYLHSG